MKKEAKKGTEKRMEKNARIIRRCGEGERRYSYIVITRRARSSGRVSKVPWHKKREGDSGGKRSSRIRLRWNDTRGKSRRRGRARSAYAEEEEEVPRVASRHKRLYDRRSSDRWKLLKPLGISRYTSPFCPIVPRRPAGAHWRSDREYIGSRYILFRRRNVRRIVPYEAGIRLCATRDSAIRIEFRAYCERV